MEVSYCTFRFGTIIVPSDLAQSEHNIFTGYHLIHHMITYYACVILSPRGKGKSPLTNLLGRLSYEKNPDTITYLRMWWQDGCHNSFPFKFPWSHLANFKIRSYLLLKSQVVGLIFARTEYLPVCAENENSKFNKELKFFQWVFSSKGYNYVCPLTSAFTSFFNQKLPNATYN